MAPETLLIFAAAFFASAITPGPDTMTLLGRSIGGGFVRALPFAVGIALAKLVLLSAALFGIAELAENARPVFVVVKWMGAGWLVFSGLRKLYSLRRLDATHPVIEPERDEVSDHHSNDGIPLSDAVVGFALGLSNPLAITFYIAILPSLIDFSSEPLRQWLPLSTTLVMMFAIVTLVWAGLGHTFHHVLTSEKARRVLAKGEGAVLVATGTAIALRQ